jgi:WD40 repeat protein
VEQCRNPDVRFERSPESIKKRDISSSGCQTTSEKDNRLEATDSLQIMKLYVAMRMGDSGEIIGQWQALRKPVIDVAFYVEARKVMGVYRGLGLVIWSFGEDGPAAIQRNSLASADALALPQITGDEALKLSKHSKSIDGISFSGDGKVAASCSPYDVFVLVWNTATGTVLRQIDIDDEAVVRIEPSAVAIWNSGDWILCAGDIGGDAHLTNL